MPYRRERLGSPVPDPPLRGACGTPRQSTHQQIDRITGRCRRHRSPSGACGRLPSALGVLPADRSPWVSARCCLSMASEVTTTERLRSVPGHGDWRIGMPLEKQVISHPDLPVPYGAYSTAVRAGDFLFVSGLAGIVPRPARKPEKTSIRGPGRRSRICAHASTAPARRWTAS